MVMALLKDPLHARFRRTLDEKHGDRLERSVLLGPRARGDAHSDYDVVEMERLADVSTSLIDETGEFVQAMPYCASAYNERTPAMLDIQKGGTDL